MPKLEHPFGRSFKLTASRADSASPGGRTIVARDFSPWFGGSFRLPPGRADERFDRPAGRGKNRVGAQGLKSLATVVRPTGRKASEESLALSGIESKSRSFVCRGLWVLVVAAMAVGISAAYAGETAAKDRGPADRYVVSLATRADVPGQAADLVRTRWAECTDCDPEEFLTQGLTVLSEEFRAALDAYDSDDYLECAALAAKLADSADPFLAVNAAAYEIKALIAADQTLEAGERIRKLMAREDDVTTYSYFAPELSFLEGYCFLADLQYDPAAIALNSFLSKYPETSPRLTIAAKQILLELANREAGKMGEVVDLMQFSGRRLKNADGSEIVQTRQQRILDLLDQMIKEAEEQEKNSCQSSAGSGSQQSQGNQSPGNPMQDSMLPGGNPAAGNLRDARRANPGESWGAMPPAERERILQALRESFPSRYRQLVEQYYEELAKKP